MKTKVQFPSIEEQQQYWINKDNQTPKDPNERSETGNAKHPGWRNSSVRKYVSELKEQLRLANIDAFQSETNAQRLADALVDLVRKIDRDNLNGRYITAKTRETLADWDSSQKQA